MGVADSKLKHRVAFLVGVRRSGTNWLRRIVDAHPDATVIPSETYLLSHGIAPLVARVQHGLRGSAWTGTFFVDRVRFLDAVRDLCDELLGGHLDTLDRPVQLIGERTPDHVRVLDLVRDIYPDSAVVHIIRDGRDVARSLVSQPWGPADHREAAVEWVSGIETARVVAPELDRYLEVRYEELLADPTREVPRIYEHLGLDVGPKVLERAIVEAGVPYNVDPEASRVEAQKWRGGLDGDDLAEVLDVAGPLLATLGYDTGATVATDTGLGPAQRIADTARRAVQRARDGRPAGSFQRQLLTAMDSTMIVLDELFGDLAARRFEGLERHFAPDARIRVTGDGESWDGRGPDSVARLAVSLAGDDALAGHQLRGDVHPSAPVFTVVSTWQTPDGRLHDRVLVVTSYGEQIDEVTWYRFPRLG